MWRIKLNKKFKLVKTDNTRGFCYSSYYQNIFRQAFQGESFDFWRSKQIQNLESEQMNGAEWKLKLKGDFVPNWDVCLIVYSIQVWIITVLFCQLLSNQKVKQGAHVPNCLVMCLSLVPSTTEQCWWIVSRYWSVCKIKWPTWTHISLAETRHVTALHWYCERVTGGPEGQSVQIHKACAF